MFWGMATWENAPPLLGRACASGSSPDCPVSDGQRHSRPGHDVGDRVSAADQVALQDFVEAFSRIHPAMFGQVLVMRLFRDH